MGTAWRVKHPWDDFPLKAEVSGSGKNEVIAEQLYLEGAESMEGFSSFVFCCNNGTEVTLKEFVPLSRGLGVTSQKPGASRARSY